MSEFLIDTETDAYYAFKSWTGMPHSCDPGAIPGWARHPLLRHCRDGSDVLARVL